MLNNPNQTQFTDDYNRTLNETMMTSMAECFAIQQGVVNILTYDVKNMPVSEFFDSVNLLKSGAQAVLEDKYPNVKQLLTPLNDCALVAFKRGLPDSILGLVEARNPSNLDHALEVALKYEARQQLNSQYPTNPYHESRYSHPSYLDSYDHNPSPHIHFTTTAHHYEASDPKLNTISDTQEVYN